MALKSFKPRLSKPRPRVAPLLGSGAERDRNRGARVSWRKWYQSPEWRAIRSAVLLANNFTCAACGRIEADTSRLVADHIRAHHGDPDLFFDMRNVQCLCKLCHDRDKQRDERKGRGV